MNFMIIQKHLVITSRGNVRIVEREPSLSASEISLKIVLDIPNSLFERPRLEAMMKVPNDAVPKSKITTTVTDNVEKIIKTATGLNMKVSIVENEEEKEETPQVKKGDLAKPKIEDGDFTNFQEFKVGQKVVFYIKNEKDKYFGEQTVTAIQKVDVGHIIQTSKTNGTWIHAHWFAPVRK